MWLSKPPAVRIFPSPAITSVPGPMMMVTPGWISGLPALPMPAIISPVCGCMLDWCSQRSSCCEHRGIECRVEPWVAAAASGDALLGPIGIVGEIVALLGGRIGMNARADIADLVGDLDQLCPGR